VFEALTVPFHDPWLHVRSLYIESVTNIYCFRELPGRLVGTAVIRRSTFRHIWVWFCFAMPELSVGTLSSARGAKLGPLHWYTVHSALHSLHTLNASYTARYRPFAETQANINHQR